MKTKLIPAICLLLIFCCSSLNSNAVNSKSNPPASNNLTVYSSPELFDLATKWAGEYTAAHPGQSFNVVKSEASGIESIIKTGNNICFVSNELPYTDKLAPVFQVVVGREIIVPVLSPKNPFLKEIYEHGISREALSTSIQVPGKMQWGTLLHNSQTEPVRFIILDDNYTKAGVSGFTKSGTASMEGIKSEDRDALVSAIQNDPYAIGFCRLTDILNANASTFAGNLLLMPIDKNGNGKMDYMEKIYDNFQDFTRGVWIGKYPKTLTNNIYCISKTQPAGESEIAFLNWVLTSGQALLQVNGYSDLVSNERQSQMDKLISTPVYNAAPKEANSTARIILLLMLVLIAVSLTLDLAVRKLRVSKIKQSGVLHGKPLVFNQHNMDIPKGLYFDKSHTWAFMEQDGTVKVGIDDFMQHITGSITSIGLKKQGLRIKKGDQLCILIQKGKQLIIHSPVTGTIMEQNLELPANSSLINDSPYSEGWVYRIQPDNWSREIEFLSMSDKYRNWLNSEFARLRDFLAASLQPQSPAYAGIIMQDGGELKDNVLADLGPEVWEDFQTKFINTSM
jgi:glycine cleavage system H lipoate-binding protein/ABC-type phosphate transport system substrate-binding protein